MSRDWHRTRRARYAKRAHDLATRPQADNSKVIWYRGPAGDHAFGGATGYMRSKCRDVRWDVRMRMVEGTVHACVGCLAVVAPPAPQGRPIAPLSPLEAAAGNGDR